MADDAVGQVAPVKFTQRITWRTKLNKEHGRVGAMIVETQALHMKEQQETESDRVRDIARACVYVCNAIMLN